MMSITHAAIAATATAITIGTADPFVLSVAVLGSQLPDLDTTESFTGRILYPIARFIEERYPHRTITHSFLSTGFVALVASPMLFWLPWQYWAALIVGQFCGWFSDAFTKAGVAAFYPSPARFVIPGNPNVRLTSKSPAEYWVLAIAVLLLIVTVNLVSAGGITEEFGRILFNDSGTAAKTFHQYGAERSVTVEVEGLNTVTGQRVDGLYTVIDASAGDIIAEDSQTGRLYKIGTAPDVQIQPTSVKVSLGDRLTISSTPQTLQEIAVSDWLARLPMDSLISGSLLLDDMEEVQIATAIDSFPTIRVFGGQIELRNARPSEINTALREFWILTGRTVVRVRS